MMPMFLIIAMLVCLWTFIPDAIYDWQWHHTFWAIYGTLTSVMLIFLLLTFNWWYNMFIDDINRYFFGIDLEGDEEELC